MGKSTIWCSRDTIEKLENAKLHQTESLESVILRHLSIVSTGKDEAQRICDEIEAKWRSDAEEKVRQVYLGKIKDYNRQHGSG